MQAHERGKFADLIRTICKPYRIELDDADVGIWWIVLQEFPFEAVESAAIEHLKTGKFAPKPADLYTRIMDGLKALWFSPDAAWAHALKAADENETVIWTTEAALAFDSARTILLRGDEVGARRAFCQEYERRVKQAIEERRSPKFVVSLGHDRQRRIAAISRAKAQGYLPAERADPLLAELKAERSEVASVATAMLTGKVIPMPSEGAQKLAEFMREALEKAEAQQRAEIEAKAAERERKRQAQEERRQRLIRQAEALAKNAQEAQEKAQEHDAAV